MGVTIHYGPRKLRRLCNIDTYCAKCETCKPKPCKVRATKNCKSKEKICKEEIYPTVSTFKPTSTNDFEVAPLFRYGFILGTEFRVDYYVPF